MSEQSRPRGILGGVCVFGLVIAIILALILVFLSRLGGIPVFPSSWGLPFVSALEEYDRELAENPGLSASRRNALLDGLEKKALDMENHFSVLKRRREAALKTGDDAFIAPYMAAAGRVQKLYPYSGQMAAVASEALLFGQVNQEVIDQILESIPLMSSGPLSNMALAFSVYSGAMGDPSTGRLLPKDLFPALCAASSGAERERYLINAAIRVLLGEGKSAALPLVQALFGDTADTAPGGAAGIAAKLDETWLFGAEFFYDHDNLLRSAELFSHFSDDEMLARQADALWLAGFSDSAGVLWQSVGVNGFSGDTKARCLYNTAAVAASPAEEEVWLGRLFAENASYEPGRVFGVIRFSRLSVQDKALAILDRTDKTEALFDLELVRRHSEAWAIDKTVAETWILVNNHPDDGRIAEWAAWYFDFQRRYGETALLLANAERSGIQGPWTELYRAFALVREGKFTEAEKAFRDSVSQTDGRRSGRSWQAAANLALLLDRDRQPRDALEFYEIAAALQSGEVNRLREVSKGTINGEAAPELKDAARVQLLVARCMRTLGQETESRRALDYALDLDPDNIDAALEKQRLSRRGIL